MGNEMETEIQNNEERTHLGVWGEIEFNLRSKFE